MQQNNKFINFSIVIPAHNEEKFIEKTLKSSIVSNYPHNKFEVIVVENGSVDNTLKKIRKIKSPLLKVYSTKKKGISFAKNFGAHKISKKTEWIIFLDADTILSKESLSQINQYITERKDKNLAIGTVSIRPLEKGMKYSFFFWFYALINKNFQASMSLQIVKRKYFERIHYDENLPLVEDFNLIRKIKKYGSYFFIPLDNVYSSARRIKKEGGIKLSLQWFFASFMPYNLLKKQNYEVIR